MKLSTTIDFTGCLLIRDVQTRWIAGYLSTKLSTKTVLAWCLLIGFVQAKGFAGYRNWICPDN